MPSPRPLVHPPWQSRGIVHGFFTRRGGVSTGLYAHLNCGPGSDDDPGHVQHNLRLCAQTLRLDNLALVRQVHSADIVLIEPDTMMTSRTRRADGMVSRCAGVGLGILTADCAPVLMIDAATGVIGAAHAGWRGAVAGVTDALLDAMRTQGAQTIEAVVGPAIGLQSYEVGEDFVRTATAMDRRVADFLASADQGQRFDLTGYVRARIQRCGAKTSVLSHDLSHDTYLNEADFFSYRRSTHRNESDYGRQLSVIGLLPPQKT